MKILRGLVLGAVAVGGLAGGWGAIEARAQETFSPEALAQINAILQEKASWNDEERKMDSALVMESKARLGKSTALNLPQMRTRARMDDNGNALVDIDATVTQDLLNAIQQLGGEIIASVPRFDSVRASVPFEYLETLASHTDIRSIRQADECFTNKINTSEGDGAHGAATARTNFGVDGTGVSIGVLSDSVDDLARLQGTGDLPAVSVLPGQSGNPGTSEGTAMLEIVYDLAPGAQLFYATAFKGQASFAQNILSLRNVGCKVIVDDIFYFAEPVFQDGIIAQAVDEVTASGVSYFSAAGNEGNFNDGTSGVYEGFFNGIPVASPFGTVTVHVFGVNQVSNQITQDSPNVFTLHWNDPNGRSGNDYDLALFNPGLNSVLAFSGTFQAGFSNPFEQISSQGFNDAGNRLVVIRTSGQNRFFHMNTLRGRLAIGTTGQIAGHPTAQGAFGIAAVDISSAPGPDGSPFTGSEPVETFSSDGPRRMFYDAVGNELTPGNLTQTGGVVRQKPDFAAADGVATATNVLFPFNPFFGTSAAAPHAAALAALLIQKGTFTTPKQVRDAFAYTAIDIEANGMDRDSGYGIVNINAALGIYCGVTLSTTNVNVPASGMAGSVVNVTTEAPCPWTAATSSNFISFNGANSGTGSSAFAFNVAPNNGLARVGTINVGDARVTVTQAGCQIPVAVVSPTSQAGCIGGSVEFNATGTGTAPVNIQWQVNEGQGFKNIPGETGPTLTVNNVTQSMNGFQYHAVFYNACGDMATTPAVLAVGQPASPSSVNATDGAFADRVRVSWSAVPGATSYRVYRSQNANGSGAVDISGAVAATQFDDLTATTGPGKGCNPKEVGIVYTYYIIATNPCGTGNPSQTDKGSVADPAKLNASLRPEHVGDFALLLLTLAAMFTFQRKRKPIA